MKVLNILFCEDVIDVQNGIPNQKKMALVSPTAAFSLPFIPSTFSFSIVVMMLGIPSVETIARICFKNASIGTILLDISAPISSLMVKNENIPSEFTGINLNIPLKNVLFENTGTYLCEVFLNGNIEKTEAIEILKNAPMK